MPDGVMGRSRTMSAPPAGQRALLRRYLASVGRRSDILVAIALGGMLGTCGRYGLSLAVPTSPDRFPWDTFVINVTGSAALGLLLVVLAERLAPNRYVRPFLGTGVTGAYTTFSTFAVEADLLVRGGHPALATGYVIGSFAAGIIAVWIGMVAGRVLSGMGRV